MDTCYQSWPATDPNQWFSLNAHCRCLPEQADPATYSYGRLSRDEDAGLCDTNCQECRWSWPADDPLKWKSDHLMARCMPSGVTPYDPANDGDNGDNGDNSTPEDTYANWQPDPSIDFTGGSCRNLYDQSCGDNCTECIWAWPLGDADTWASSDAMCRCAEKKTFTDLGFGVHLGRHVRQRHRGPLR